MPVYTRSKSTREEDTEISQAEQGANMATTPTTLNDIMAEIKKGNEETDKRLVKLKKKIDNNQNLLKDYIKSNDEALNKVTNKVGKLENNHKVGKLENNHKAMNDTVKGIKNRLTGVTDKLDQIQKTVNDQQKLLDMLHKKDQDQEVEKKRANIIIDGIKEDEIKNTRQTVTKLLSDIGISNVNENVVTAFRLGTINPKTHARPRPRPILVKLSQQGFKYDVYKNVKHLKDLDDGKKIFIKDDLPQEISKQRQELRCQAAAARDRGFEATVRGGAIIVDNKKYSYSEIADLPEGVSMENAKRVTGQTN